MLKCGHFFGYRLLPMSSDAVFLINRHMLVVDWLSQWS